MSEEAINAVDYEDELVLAAASTGADRGSIELADDGTCWIEWERFARPSQVKAAIRTARNWRDMVGSRGPGQMFCRTAVVRRIANDVILTQVRGLDV